MVSPLQKGSAITFTHIITKWYVCRYIKTHAVPEQNIIVFITLSDSVRKATSFSFHLIKRMRGRRPAWLPPCHFEDSDGDCHAPQPRGVCTTPKVGAAALVQHADLAALCKLNPPFGFRPLCTGAIAVTKCVHA